MIFWADCESRETNFGLVDDLPGAEMDYPWVSAGNAFGESVHAFKGQGWLAVCSGYIYSRAHLY